MLNSALDTGQPKNVKVLSDVSMLAAAVMGFIITESPGTSFCCSPPSSPFPSCIRFCFPPRSVPFPLCVRRLLLWYLSGCAFHAQDRSYRGNLLIVSFQVISPTIAASTVSFRSFFLGEDCSFRSAPQVVRSSLYVVPSSVRVSLHEDFSLSPALRIQPSWPRLPSCSCPARQFAPSRRLHRSFRSQGDWSTYPGIHPR
jgi:hypothetical protein